MNHHTFRAAGPSEADGTLLGPLLTLSPAESSSLTALFKLLSDRTRLAILQLLSAGERNVTRLCEELDLPQPTVSHHLGLLRMSRLIDNRRSGKQIFYKLNGRVSPAAVGGADALARTAGSEEVLHGGTPPAGLQIKGDGFAVQILTDADDDPHAVAR